MRHTRVSHKFYNRQSTLGAARPLMGNGEFNLVVGPPSCGKTALMLEAMPKINSFVIKLDLRGVDTTKPKFVRNAFRKGFKAASRDFQQPPAALKALFSALVTNATDLPPGVPADVFDYWSGTDHENSSNDDLVIALDFIVDHLLKDGSKVVIFIDEYAELFSKGKEHLMWRDELAHALEKVFIRHTKQRTENPATVIVTTSDQQYYAHFNDHVEKGFVTTTCLGYMSAEESEKYLELELKVASEEARTKIVAHAGGHFTELQHLARAEKRGRLDAAIVRARAASYLSLDNALDRLEPKHKATFLKKIVPTLAEKGFMARSAAKAVDPKMLESLIRYNVISLRYAMPEKEWRADLDFEDVCITPFVPRARGTMKKMVDEM
jgi:hypothetical protein